MGKAWTEEEEVLLKENYFPRGKNTLLSKLSNRTWCAIKSKARKMGLSFLRWTNKEEETLREMYDKNTKEMSILLNRTIGSVQQKAIRMGLTKVVN